MTVSGRLNDKAAIVTGAGRGLGLGIALALAAEGANVVLAGRSLDVLENAAAEIRARGGRALPVRCDIADAADLAHLVQSAVAEFGTVDILINNAMFIPHGTLLDISDESIDSAWATGFKAVLHLMRLCHPYLTGGGSIVNVSSSESLGPTGTEKGVYASVKAALNTLSRAAANEWGADGIRINQVMPWGKSDAVASWMANSEDEAAAVLEQTPLARCGDPEADIGRVVAFLCSDDAAFVTGTTIPADGGRAYLR